MKILTFIFAAISAIIGCVAFVYNIRIQRNNSISRIVDTYIQNLSDPLNREEGISGLIRAGICEVNSKNSFWQIIHKIETRTRNILTPALTNQYIITLKKLHKPTRPFILFQTNKYDSIIKCIEAAAKEENVSI